MFDFNSFSNNIILVSVIVPIVIMAMVLFVTWKIFSSVGATGKERNRLMREGVAAQATIMNIWETGLYVNNRPMIGILLEVISQDGRRFQAETKMIISQLQIPQFQPGTRVAVKVDPTDFTKIAIAGVIGRETSSGWAR